MDSNEEKEQRVLSAIQSVKNGEKQISAARRFNIAPSTLSRRLHDNTRSHTEGARHLQRLSPEHEKIIADWITVEEASGRAPTRAKVRAFAQCMTEAQGETHPVGKTWFNGFIRRNPHVKAKVGRKAEAEGP